LDISIRNGNRNERERERERRIPFFNWHWIFQQETEKRERERERERKEPPPPPTVQDHGYYIPPLSSPPDRVTPQDLAPRAPALPARAGVETDPVE
jgi:hypothetical protein